MSSSSVVNLGAAVDASAGVSQTAARGPLKIKFPRWDY